MLPGHQILISALVTTITITDTSRHLFRRNLSASLGWFPFRPPEVDPPHIAQCWVKRNRTEPHTEIAENEDEPRFSLDTVISSEGVLLNEWQINYRCAVVTFGVPYKFRTSLNPLAVITLLCLMDIPQWLMIFVLFFAGNRLDITAKLTSPTGSNERQIRLMTSP